MKNISFYSKIKEHKLKYPKIVTNGTKERGN